MNIEKLQKIKESIIFELKNKKCNNGLNNILLKEQGVIQATLDFYKEMKLNEKL